MNVLDAMRAELGVAEIDGPKSNPRILAYAKASGYTPTNGEADPWCGNAMGYVAKQCGLPLPEAPWRANSWAKWGTPCEPKIGAVAVFKRGKSAAQGHVTIIDRIDGDWLYCIGGNQNDSVSIAKFPRSSLRACRWPPYPEPVAVSAIDANLGTMTAGQVLKPTPPPIVSTLKGSRTIAGVLISALGYLVTYLGDGLAILMQTAASVAEWEPAGGVLASLGLSPSVIGGFLAFAGLALALYARIDDATKGRGSSHDRPA